MIKLENTNVYGWEAAIRGMRNPMNSWGKSDSAFAHGDGYMRTLDGDREKAVDFVFREFNEGREYQPNILDQSYVGPNDHDLMMRLAKAGSVDAKYRRMLNVTVDITAPLYWWKEFDTYKVGTVANSCSTMHKIHSKEFTTDDFSWEHLLNNGLDLFEFVWENGMFAKNVQPIDFLTMFVIPSLNKCREKFLETKDKVYWWQMIQLLPSSYNQRRTVQLNYEVLAGIYPKRKDHKLDEWHDFCDWINGLPYSELITLEESA